MQHLSLDVQPGAEWPVATPGDNACLAGLTLETNIWPAPFLQAHAPCLRQLQLTLGWLRRYAHGPWPVERLPALPQLETLVLRVNSETVWLAGGTGLLAQAPRLRTLELDASAADWPPLPRDFLAYAPQLQTLSLALHESVSRVPAPTLGAAPQLTQFRLQAPGLRALPRGFLAHAPRLRRLEMETPALHGFAADFLAHAPQLATLAVTTGALEALPDAFLARAPQLQRLSLYLGLHAKINNVLTLPDGWPLPPGFLARAPQLQRLDLDLDLHAKINNATPLPDGWPLPPGFLARAPQLQRLDLDLDLDLLVDADADVTTNLPVNLDAADVRHALALPAGFLARAPQLQRLDLALSLSLFADIDADALAAPDGWRLPAGFLAHAPQLVAFNLDAPRLAAWPDDFLAHAPRLQTLHTGWPGRAADLYLPALTAIGDRALAHAPALDALALDAPRLAAVGEDFLARADRLQTLALRTAAPAPLRLGARFLARAPQVRAVRIGATAAPDAQTDLAAAALAAPAAFLADLPRLRTLELRTPLRDPPPPGFLRGTALRDLRLRVRIAADAQAAPRLPAVAQAAHWHLELTCDSAYPDAWLAPLAAAPPAALTVAPCQDETARRPAAGGRPLAPPPPALRAFLAAAPPATRLRVPADAQWPPAAYAHLPVQALEFMIDGSTFTGWERAADAPPRPRAGPEALHLVFRWAADVALRPLADALAAPALFLDLRRGWPRVLPQESGLPQETLVRFLRTPPAHLRHAGAHMRLAAPGQVWNTPLHRDLAAALPALDVACLQLVLPALNTPLPARLRAAARRHGLALRLVAGLDPHRLSSLNPSLDRDQPGLDGAAYFQQQHLPWAAAHACPRSLLLIDDAPSNDWANYLTPDLLDRPGALQRLRIVFDPRQCPDCRPDP